MTSLPPGFLRPGSNPISTLSAFLEIDTSNARALLVYATSVYDQHWLILTPQGTNRMSAPTAPTAATLARPQPLRQAGREDRLGIRENSTLSRISVSESPRSGLVNVDIANGARAIACARSASGLPFSGSRTGILGQPAGRRYSAPRCIAPPHWGSPRIPSGLQVATLTGDDD